MRGDNNDLFWENKIKAFFHDPPDKLLSIKNHEQRRDKMLDAVNLRYDIQSTFDRWASQMQRFSIKSDSANVYDFHRTDRSLWPYFVHTISAVDIQYKHIESAITGVHQLRTNKLLEQVLEVEVATMAKLFSRDASIKRNYFVLWRFYKDKLFSALTEKFDSNLANELINLPADSRIPDHTIWEHLDMASAIYGANTRGKPGLLMFKISPVQTFISAARKEKDLWAGSHLLSYLSFLAILQVIEEFGPDAVIFPYLRGQTFLDLELFNDYITTQKEKEELLQNLLIANIPNRFLALISVDTQIVSEIRTKIRNTIIKTLMDIAEEAIDNLIFKDTLEELKKFGIDKDKIVSDAKRVIAEYFKITVDHIEVPLINELQNADSIEKSYTLLIDFVKNLRLPDSTKNKYLDWLELSSELSDYKAAPLNLYGLMFEILSESVGYTSSVNEKEELPSGFKCTMCGRKVAMMGDVDSKKTFRNIWNVIASKHIEIKENERLCPVCLLKRYYPVWFKKKVAKKIKDFSIPIKFEEIAYIALSKTIIHNKEPRTYLEAIVNHKEYPALKNLVLHMVDFFRLEKLGSLINSIGYKNRLPPQLHYIESYNIDRFIKDWGIEKIDKKGRDELLRYLSEIRRKLTEIYKDIGEPPKYYAILVIDGDGMGKTLIGDTVETFTKYLHRTYLAKNKDKLEKAIDAVLSNDKPIKKTNRKENIKRILNSNIHIAISKALMNFSVKKVREIVERNNGILIYSGGDDVLALLPMDTAVNCALEISSTFKKSFDGWEMLPGLNMSGGILISHYLNPLFDSVEKARALEAKAKSQKGKNSLFVGYLKRGGQYTIAGGKWDIYKNPGFIRLLKYLEYGDNDETLHYFASPQLFYDILQFVESVDSNALEAYLISEFRRHIHKKENVTTTDKDTEVKFLVREILHVAKASVDPEKSSINTLQKSIANIFLLLKNLYEANALLREE